MSKYSRKPGRDDDLSGYSRKGRRFTTKEHEVVFDKQIRYIEGRNKRKQQKETK